MQNTIKKESKKPLLILDINGLFVHRVYKTDICKIETNDVKKVGNYIIYKREGIDDFLKKIFKIFHVAVWSSARIHNINNILNYIFEGREKELLFVWSQKECKKKYKKNSKPNFLKNLSLVNENFPQYNVHNIYIVDDTKEKMYNNPKNNCIIVNQWIPTNIEVNKTELQETQNGKVVENEVVERENNQTLDDIFLLILRKIKD